MKGDGMNVLSVCSGVGGMDRGLEAAGMTVVGLCEIDRYARAVLAHHWPNTPMHDNLTTLNGADWYGRIDLVAGGTPCTDLSLAGRRAGLGGEHSRLFWDFCRVADTSATDWVLWENVAGALSSHRGDDFAAVLWGLTGHRPAVPANGWRTIGMCVGPHRTAVWRLLDAQWFGVAQRRRRVFVVAGPRAVCSLSLLVEPESVPRGARPGREARDDIAGTLGGGAGGRGWCPDTGRMTFVPTLPASHGHAQTGHNVLSFHHTQDPITSTEFTHSLSIDGGGGVLSFTAKDHGADCTEELSPTLRAGSFDKSHMNGGVMPAIVYPLAMRGRADGAELEVGEPDTYNALRAGNGGSSRQNGVLTPELAVRRLTPRECERLMGWPDDWTRYGHGDVEISDSQRYKMCGNGVVSPVAEWIGRRIIKAAT